MVMPGFIWNTCLPLFVKPQCKAVDRPQPTENPEEGSGTVLAVGIIAALLILATVIIGFAGVSTANRRAAQAADLAALAAADALRGITPGDPCDIAAQVARNNNANLVGCALADRPETVDIRVSSAVHGPFAFFGDAQGTSRAGAPHPDSGEGAPDEGLSSDEIPENAPSNRTAEEPGSP